MSNTSPVHSHPQSSPSLETYLRSHSLVAFRLLLFGGNLLLLIVLLSIGGGSPSFQRYDGWLAGLAATLGLLFVFALASTHINGHRRYRDSWLILATIIMFALSAIFTILALVRI